MIALDALRVDSLLSYLIAIVAPALDAILPVIPSETAVITLGVATAGSADPRIALLVLCSAAGAFLGDNLCYLLGRRFAPWIERRFFRSEKGQRSRDWAERSLERYGMPLIIVCRFIPGGRTAVMLSCGIVRYDRRRFVIATAAAGLIWASYSFFIGRLGGKAFEDKPWAGLLLALGIAVAISGIIEAIRRIRSRRARSTESDRGHDAAPERHDAAPERHDAAPERRNASSEPHDAASEPRNAVAEPHDAASEPRNAVAERHDAASEPRNAVAEPRNAASEPRNAVAEPRNAALEPSDAAERFDDTLKRPYAAPERRHEPTSAGTAPSSETSGPH